MYFLQPILEGKQAGLVRWQQAAAAKNNCRQPWVSLSVSYRHALFAKTGDLKITLMNNDKNTSQY